MTVAHAAPTVNAISPEAALNVMRGDGLRISTARRAVVRALFAADAPISAERIAAGGAGEGLEIDLASVYRSLEALERLGLVRHFHAGHGAGRYVLAGVDERGYLACERCGECREVDAAELERIRGEIRRRLGFEARFDHFPIVGRCRGCSEETA